MAKQNRENVILEMVILLEKGAKRGEAMAKNGEDWQLSTRTFDRYWKQAQDKFRDSQEEIHRELTDQRKEAASKRLSSSILTREERMEIASKIARGEGRRVGGEVLIPTDGDRLKAIDYLSKLEGDYAPKKIDHTTDGESLNKEKELDPMAPVNLTVNVIERRADADIQRTSIEGPVQPEAGNP